MKFVTHINFRKKLFLFGMLNLLIWAIIGIAGIYLFRNIILQKVAVIFMFLPLLFIPLLLKASSKKMEINFSDDFFSVCIGDQNNKVQEIQYSNIRSYCIEFPNDKFNSIKFNFNDGQCVEYSFFQKKKDIDDIETADLINVFHAYIRSYNLTASDLDKVLFKPSFYATNIGLAVIISLSILLVIGVFLTVLYGAKKVPITFLFSLILIISLITKRSKDLKYYKNIINTSYSN